MDAQRPEDATKLAALPRHSAIPWVCVADPRQQMRTFLADTLQDLSCVTRDCADVAELGAGLDLRPRDLVVIGLAAGGIEACEMVELLAATCDKRGRLRAGGPHHLAKAGLISASNVDENTKAYFRKQSPE